ncbi:hypothetical protein M378DRAFT_366212 [Amanita muscaria Koide BX008]|uniref:Uncharacterized protein n=1 Tax=Amanita muscaria (strain Koide BX008) TaxID=946122 RepID=A0A0C2S4S2_AMAMK|nr:hypothetical protein M378DRAFT_366212 [Amanita muscaria Koide BX008]
MYRFKQLQRLNFYVPSDASDANDSLRQEVSDLKSVLYKERRLKLVLVCPDDYSMLVRLAREGDSFEKNDNRCDEVSLHAADRLTFMFLLDLWNPNTGRYDDPLD